MPTAQKPRFTKVKTSTRGRGRSLARHGDPADVRVRVDPKRKAAYDALVAKMHKERRAESSGFDAFYESVGAILDGDLYTAGGYDSPEAFITAIVKEPPRTVFRNVRVARYASPDEEAKYGPTLLDAALSYIEATTGGPVSGRLPIKFEALRFEVERDGETHRLSLEDVTRDEVVSATRKKTRGTANERARSSPAEQAIARALHGVGSLAGVTVKVTGGMLRLGGVPLAAFEHFRKALRSIDLAKIEAHPAPIAKKARGAKKGRGARR